MREPTGAPPATGTPEPASARPASSITSTDDTPTGDAVARMEQVIDAFIWHDRDERPEAYAFMSSAAADAAGDGQTDIVARLAPPSLAGSERLPRIVTSSLPIKPPGSVHDDHWRRQFLDALNQADDGTPLATARPLPSALDSGPPTARGRPYRMAHEHASQHHVTVDDPSRLAAGWRTAQRALVTAVALTCVFSTGVLWATHRSEIVAETNGQPAEIAAVIPVPAEVGDAAPGQSIRNTPVLIREGESVMLTSILPRIINGGETTNAVPGAPIAPVVRVVPVVPIAAAAQVEGAVAPGLSIVDAVASPSPSQPVGPPPDRDGLAALAARAAAPPAIHHEPATPKHRVAAVPAGRVSSVPFSKRGPVPEVERSQVPPTGWVQRRQSLRVEPEPEPSTFKKLIGLVWPPGKSSTPAEPPKPAAAPAVTPPAVTAPAYSWSDSARANP